MPRTVLITGAQGFIGRYLVSHWLTSSPGDQVIGLGRSPGNLERFTHSVTWGDERVPAPLPEPLRATLNDARYRYHAVPLTDRDAMKDVLEQTRPDVVVHLAGALRDETAEHLFRSNVLGTEQLLECIALAGIGTPRFIHGSSGIIGADSSGKRLPVADDAIGSPVDLYTVSKAATEQVARIVAARHGIPLVIARIFNVVGPGQDERHICGWLARQCAHVITGRADDTILVGPRDTTRDFVDVRDVAAALHLLADRGAAGETYNVATGRETAIAEVFDGFIARLPRPVMVTELPARPKDVMRHVADVSKIEALGHRTAVPLADSITETLQYYLDLDARAIAPAPAPDRGAAQFLEVAFQQRHGYTIEVRNGLLTDLPATLQCAFPDRRMVVLTDDKVSALVGRDLTARMQGCGISAAEIVVPEGERSKSFETLRDVIAHMYELGFDRRALLVTLGGGVIMDLGGFAASCYMRGVEYVNVPTTLLAQHDAAIGGKVAVNAPWAKNFVGAFHHPRAVYCDPAVLTSLPLRDLNAGIAEAIKVGLIADAALIRLLESHAHAIQHDRDPKLLEEIVLRAARGKVDLLAPDPLETDLRRPLNLGHTFGHPLETRLAYQGLLHGEAVAMGMAVATAASESMGICAPETAERIFRLLRAYDLPPKIALSDLLAARDNVRAVRLVRGNRLHFVLPAGIGSYRIVPDLPDHVLTAAIEHVGAHPMFSRAV